MRSKNDNTAATAEEEAAEAREELPYYPGLTKKQLVIYHLRRGKHKDGIDKRRCSICGTGKTRLKVVNKWHIIDGSKYDRYPHWYKDGKGGHICFSCFMRSYMKKYLRKKREEQKREGEREQKKKAATKKKAFSQ